MIDPLLLIFIFVVGLPIGWFISEYYSNRPIRIILGILALLSSFGVAAIIGKLSEFNYNAWYGCATKDLITTIIEQTEDGQGDRVLKTLRALDAQYTPTYENRADYQTLVEDATDRMRGDMEIVKGTVWDAPIFDRATWNGHWEEGSGFWIVIHDVEDSFDIVRSGTPQRSMEAVALSDDHRTLAFQEGDQWRHTLTLVNQYEAKHEWFDLKKQKVWEVNLIQKLVRPTVEQRTMTHQDK